MTIVHKNSTDIFIKIHMIGGEERQGRLINYETERVSMVLIGEGNAER